MDNENGKRNNSNLNTEDIQHSGSKHLPDEMREQPVREYDKTPLSAVYDDEFTLPEGATAAPLLNSESAPLTNDTREKDASKPWYKSLMVKIGAPVVGVAAASALVAGLMLPKGDADPVDNAPAPNPNETSQTTDDEPTTPATDGETDNQSSDAERIINDPSRVSPEKIAAMSPQELTEFSTITFEEAPTPEDFSKQFVVIYDAWVNAGATEQEARPFENSAKGVYETAMADKYDGVFKSSLLPSADTGWIESVHNSVNNSFMGSMLLEKTPYTVATVFKSVEVVSDTGTTNGFRVIITAEVANNTEESGVSEFTHEDNTLKTVSWDLTVGGVDGKYVVAAYEGAN